jgi:hypothetical protein
MNNRLIDQHHKKHPPGQGMTEFALILPVLMLVVTGVIAMGHLFFSYIMTVSASREGTRYGSVVGINEEGNVQYRDCNNIRAAARRVGWFANIADENIAITYDHGPGTNTIGNCPIGGLGPVLNSGDRINVRIDILYSPIIPLVPIPTFNMGAESARTILREVVIGTIPPMPTSEGTNTPTITPSNTPTETPTPTNTLTETPGPSPTASMTFTPWPTSTPTNTPTVTPTPTNTSSPTPTATPIYCPAAGQLVFGESTLLLSLTNEQTYPLTIVRVEVTWPYTSPRARIQLLNFGAATLWTANIGLNPPAVSFCETGCSATWSSPYPQDRTLGASESKVMTAGYSRNIPNGFYSLRTVYSNGCSLTISGTK